MRGLFLLARQMQNSLSNDEITARERKASIAH
jgi:hypothetical protein